MAEARHGGAAAGSSGYGRKTHRDSTFLRILVEGKAGTGAEEREIAAAVVGALADPSFGEGWRVSRLFGPMGEDDELARFYAVTGAVDAYELPKLAWEVSYRLAAALAGVAVEVIPDLPSSLSAPPPPEVHELEAAAIGLPYDWGLTSIRAQKAWALPPPAGGAARGTGISIGPPDTGYKIHPDYEVEALDLARDADVISGDDDATDPLQQRAGYNPGHGTRTGSVIAGRASGVLTGVAPAAPVVPIRTIKSVVQSFDGDVAKAVHYARGHDCHVISMSLGGLGFRGLEGAIDRAVGEGLIVMAAAGNYLDGLGHRVVAPARYRNCIAVGAMNASDAGWEHSSRGSKVAVSAPGEDVWVPDVWYGSNPPVVQESGTSFAVAHLAGAAALWLAYHGRDALLGRYGAPNLQRAFVTALRASAREPANWDVELGAGIVDAEALLKAGLPAVAELEMVEPELAEDELEALFPGLGPDAVGELIPIDPQDPRWPTLRRELLYVLTENRQLHGKVEGISVAGVEAAREGLRELLAPYASPTLAASMGARGGALGS